MFTGAAYAATYVKNKNFDGKAGCRLHILLWFIRTFAAAGIRSSDAPCDREMAIDLGKFKINSDGGAGRVAVSIQIRPAVQADYQEKERGIEFKLIFCRAYHPLFSKTKWRHCIYA